MKRVASKRDLVKILDVVINHHRAVSQQMLEQLGRRRLGRLSFRWWMQPSKSQATGSAWDLSLRSGETVESCKKCAVWEKMCHQGKEFQVEMSSPYNIKEHEREIDGIISEPQQLEEPQPPFAIEGQAVSIPSTKVNKKP